MRIVITGISGQIGGALLTRLAGHDVIAAGRSTIDLTRPHLIASVLDDLRPELLINCAAFTAVDKAESEHEAARLVNAHAPAAMAAWSRRAGATLVQLSTDYVFDGSGERPWREDDECSPLSVYGMSKREGELAVLGEGGSALVVRTSWVYGATGNNFLRTIARLAQQREQLRVVADQIGAPTSSTYLAQSLAAMIGDDIETMRERCRESAGIVHLAAAGETSWHGFASAIVAGLVARNVPLKVTEVVPISTAEYPTAAKRPLNSRLSMARLRKVFGLVPAPWEHALELELDRYTGIERAGSDIRR
jgi:dTDP-4-dehydrorhamnose reductase